MSLNCPKKRVLGGHRRGTGTHTRPGVAAARSQPCQSSRPRRERGRGWGYGGPQSCETQRAEAKGRAGRANVSAQEETPLPSEGLGGSLGQGNRVGAVGKGNWSWFWGGKLNAGHVPRSSGCLRAKCTRDDEQRVIDLPNANSFPVAQLISINTSPGKPLSLRSVLG